MKAVKIAPSILSADFTRLGEEVAAVLAAGADYIHVDVMDGDFVPNISIGVPVLQSLSNAYPEAFFDVHLMISRPERYVAAFCSAGASHITIHVEADTPAQTTKALHEIHGFGVGVGLSVKPGTPIWAMEPWLDKLDMVLVMTVEPGFGGQRFMPDMLPKIRALRERLDRVNPGCSIEADGGIVPGTAGLIREAGGEVLVAGSAVFTSGDYRRAIASLRRE